MSTNDQQDVVSGYYENYKETQKEIFSVESRRVRNSILWVAGLLFASDMLSLVMVDLVTGELVLYALLFPGLFAGIAFLGLKQPMLAAVLALLLFVGIIILSIVAFGSIGAVRGLIVKAIMIYFLFAAFQSARTAEQAKKEMN